MSTTTTTTAASSSSTACSAKVWELPTTDVACGAFLKGNMSDVFDDCCKGDAPVKYENDCGIYCLAQGQTKHELQDCLTSKSNVYREVFCNGDKPNATATAAASTTRSTSSGTHTGTSTATTTGNAAVVNQPISKSGLGVVAMLFCSAMMGVLA